MTGSGVDVGVNSLQIEGDMSRYMCAWRVLSQISSTGKVSAVWLVICERKITLVRGVTLAMKLSANSACVLTGKGIEC